jgi:hypothetical protein
MTLFSTYVSWAVLLPGAGSADYSDAIISSALQGVNMHQFFPLPDKKRVKDILGARG